MVEVKATFVALGTSATYVGREFVSAQGPNAPKIFVRSGKQLFGGKVGFESYRTNIRENKNLGPEGFPPPPRLRRSSGGRPLFLHPPFKAAEKLASNPTGPTLGKTKIWVRRDSNPRPLA
jgi:hypothetical protein